MRRGVDEIGPVNVGVDAIARVNANRGARVGAVGAQHAAPLHRTAANDAHPPPARVYAIDVPVRHGVPGPANVDVGARHAVPLHNNVVPRRPTHARVHTTRAPLHIAHAPMHHAPAPAHQTHTPRVGT